VESLCKHPIAIVWGGRNTTARNGSAALVGACPGAATAPAARAVPRTWPRSQAGLGSGHIVLSETEAPHMLVNMV
jgi:hypothetical protein